MKQIKGEKVLEVLDVPPQVQKMEEFNYFLTCISNGMWKGNTKLAELCSVDANTIALWKKRPEVIKLHQEAFTSELARWKKTGRTEDRLKEMGMDFEPEKTESVVRFYVTDFDDV